MEVWQDMKKLFSVTLSAIVFSLIISSSAHAGTVMVGAKMWYAQWASAPDKAVAEVLANSSGIQTAYPGTTATVNPGSGFMAGPVLGYQTDDHKWSISSAFMVFNSFSQKTDWNFGGAGSLKTKTSMNRSDIDLSVSYLLIDWLKIYAGYKYTASTYKVTFDDGSDFYKITYTANIPTAGVAVAFPITERITIGAQAGILYVMPSYKWDAEKLKTDKSIGYNIEPNISILLTENFMMQFGIRYQIYNVKFTDPAFDMTKNDEFLGVTLAGIFLW
jgi:hypothetical protein